MWIGGQYDSQIQTKGKRWRLGRVVCKLWNVIEVEVGRNLEYMPRRLAEVADSEHVMEGFDYRNPI